MLSLLLLGHSLLLVASDIITLMTVSVIISTLIVNLTSDATTLIFPTVMASYGCYHCLAPLPAP